MEKFDIQSCHCEFQDDDFEMIFDARILRIYDEEGMYEHDDEVIVEYNNEFYIIEDVPEYDNYEIGGGIEYHGEGLTGEEVSDILEK